MTKKVVNNYYCCETGDFEPESDEKLYILSEHRELTEPDLQDLTTGDGLVIYHSRKKAKKQAKKQRLFDGKRRFVITLVTE